MNEFIDKKTEMDKKKEEAITMLVIFKLKQDKLCALIKEKEGKYNKSMTEEYELADLKLDEYKLALEILAKEQFLNEYIGRDVQFRQFIEANIAEIKKHFWDVIMDARKLAYETKGIPFKKVQKLQELMGRYQTGFKGEYADYEMVQTYITIKNEVEDIKGLLDVQKPKV